MSNRKPPIAKSDIVSENISSILHQHKNSFADAIERNQTSPEEAYNTIDASYRRALNILSKQYRNRVHKIHYELFQEETKSLLENLIAKDVLSNIKQRLLPLAILILLASLTTLLWMI
jgi:ferric iron reductase protein FhuF